MNYLSFLSISSLILLFFIITYAISVIEKITEWKNTVSYITAHFKNSPLKKYVSPLLIILIFFEIIALLFLITGLLFSLTKQNNNLAIVGLQVSAITLLFMLIGQRLAKDYSGAMNINIYFIINILGIYLLT